MWPDTWRRLARLPTSVWLIAYPSRMTDLGHQSLGDFAGAVQSQRLDRFRSFAGDGMVYDHHRVIGHTQRLGPEFGRFSENLSDNCYRRPAPLLSFYSVVETSRCAGASISHRMDDGVAFGGKAI